MQTNIPLFLRRAYSLWQNAGLGTRICISLMIGSGLEWYFFPARAMLCHIAGLLFWILVLAGIVKLVIKFINWSNSREGREFFANS
jgi:hypothetical protein